MNDTAEKINLIKINCMLSICRLRKWFDYWGNHRSYQCNFIFLEDQISISFNKLHKLPPMFYNKVELRDGDVVFDPSINFNKQGNGIRNII
jgi:hypothetical protein